LPIVIIDGTLLLMEPLRGSCIIPDIASYCWWNRSAVHMVLASFRISYPIIDGTAPRFWHHCEFAANYRWPCSAPPLRGLFFISQRN